MKRILRIVAVASATACSTNRENSAACGLASIAAGSMVLQSLGNLNMVVSEVPAQVPSELPAKVIGHGTARVMVAAGPEGLAMGYVGEGFPPVPGFGLLLVDDSSETLRGVLIYEPEGPGGYPAVGSISGSSGTIPLYGLRVHWPSLNAPKCPLFAPRLADST